MEGIRFILISRRALEGNLEGIKELLTLLPINGALAASPKDAEAARQISDQVIGFTAPYAIVADFDVPAQIVYSDGSVQDAELQLSEVPQSPLVELV